MKQAELRLAILEHIRSEPMDHEAYLDYFTVCREHSEAEECTREACEWARELRPYLADALSEAVRAENYDLAQRFDDLIYRTLLFTAPVFFEDYLDAIEYHKPNAKKFYQPRRRVLKPIVDAYQELADGKIKFLSVSMPKRTGKSQTGINFAAWMAGRFPDKSILMEGAGDALVNSFYKGLLEYIVPPTEYNYYDIFPDVAVSGTDAHMKTLNLNTRSRFPTLMCRSIDASQVGLSEATSLLYLDDCVESREEAKNRVRLDSKWETISGDVIGRAIEGTPIVICGTRYSLYDPIGHMQEHAQREGWAWKAIEIPALDLVSDESNYEIEIDGQKRFTTQYFREQRNLISAEQFESEFQQQPFEAKGILFPKEELNYYFELPADKEPDAVVAVCDTAESGEDSCALLVAKIYGSDVYIADLVFDNAPPSVTKPECANAIIRNLVETGTFESNNAGTYFARDVQTILEQKQYRCTIRTKRTISNKQTRIEFASDGIKKNFYFKHPSTYPANSQYALFMRELTTYTRSGKVKHDDAPDSLSLLENELRFVLGNPVEVMQRPF